MEDSDLDEIGKSLDKIYRELYERVKPYGMKGAGDIESLDIFDKVKRFQEIMSHTWKIEVDSMANEMGSDILEKRLEKAKEDLEEAKYIKEGGSGRKKSKNGNSYAYKKDIDSKVVVNLYKRGISIKEIADRLKISRPTVYNRLKEMGVYESPKEKEGSQNSDPPLNY